MKVLLLHPPNTSIYSKEVRATKQKGVPLGLLYIARVAIDSGCETKVIDAEAENLEIDECVNEIVKWEPDLLGITVTTPMVQVAAKIATYVKEQKENIKICVGGPHISALSYETACDFKCFDYLVYGEGEETFKELIDRLQSGKDLNLISGLVRQERHPVVGRYGLNRVIQCSGRSLISDLNTINYPARQLTSTNLYTTTRLGSKEVYTQVTSSRGCPMKCIFCGSCAIFGTKARFRSVENVIGEIKECIERYSIKSFTFNDDTFTLNKNRTIKFCNEVRDLNIHFFCSVHAKTLDEEVLQYLKGAGCYGVSLGVESGNDEILHRINKHITTNDIRRVVKLIKKVGIQIFANYMIGNLGETSETIKQTIEFAKELQSDMVQFSIAIPYPGTEFYNRVGASVTKDWSQYHWYDSVVYTPDGLTKQDLVDFQKLAYEEHKQINQQSIGR